MHGGGYLGAYSGRIDHAWGARSDCQANLPKPPTQLSEAKSISTPWCSRRMQLEALVKTFGVDHIIMGTDYPFDMLEYDPIGHINSVESFDARHPRRARRRQCEEDAGAVNRRSRVQKIQHRGFRDHRAVGAVQSGARLLFLRLRRLQIGAEMARALDDAVVLRAAAPPRSA